MARYKGIYSLTQNESALSFHAWMYLLPVNSNKVTLYVFAIKLADFSQLLPVHNMTQTLQ